MLVEGSHCTWLTFGAPQDKSLSAMLKKSLGPDEDEEIGSDDDGSHAYDDGSAVEDNMRQAGFDPDRVYVIFHTHVTAHLFRSWSI